MGEFQSWDRHPPQTEGPSETKVWWPLSARARIADLEAENAHLRKSIANSDRDHWFERAGDLEAERDRAHTEAAQWLSVYSADAAGATSRESKAAYERVRKLRAEVERLRSFPPCCYDGLGNEGRGCQLLTDLEVKLASLEGEQ